MKSLVQWLSSVEGLPWWRLYLRLVWIVIQVSLAYFFASRSNPFFYQGF